MYRIEKTICLAPRMLGGVCSIRYCATKLLRRMLHALIAESVLDAAGPTELNYTRYYLIAHCALIIGFPCR